ncbi:MAG: carboxypeptidase M32 [Verrucomicrobiales bacterium]|nr:carboxypeptidase M32 [Verrucomicrobiales bacterium]
MNFSDAYQALHGRFREVTILKSAVAQLSWDQETNMPPRSAAFRGTQLAFLSGQHHRLATAPEVGRWLGICEETGAEPGSAAETNLRGWRRDHDLAVKIPPELVEEMARTTTAGHHAWIDARKKSEFGIFQPHLEKIVALCRQQADCLGWEDCRYDALLDQFEPGVRSAEIAALFDDLGPKLASLIGPAAERSRSTPANLLEGHYPIAVQQQFNQEVAAAFGFDFSAGRIDTSAHPFCTGLGPHDTRMTTRYDEADFLDSLSSVLHETGHGLYEQGLDSEQWNLPAGEAVSMGIHESQSRLWENHVGRSTAFWTRWLPRAAEMFPHLARLTPEQMAAASCRVKPSFIRVEADEVTYDQHIILRFTLERQVISGHLAVADIPAAWNELFLKLLGMKVPDDARGCLQDIHWSFGGFGYFATYTLGNLNASQLMERAGGDIPDLDARLSRGDYQPLLAFVREKVHRHGRRFQPQALMKLATGEPTGTRCHLEYLREKYCR